MTGPPLPNVIIAGVNKAGTTTVFSLLGAHPSVHPSRIKETGHFLTHRYGEPPRPVAEYRRHFIGWDGEPFVMESTPGYLYGGPQLIGALRRNLDRPRIIVVLREPVSRLVSFFRFQQSMLQLPAGLDLSTYVRRCLDLDAAALRRRSNNPWFGVEGGRYGEYFGPWRDAFGEDLGVWFFDELVTDTTGTVRAMAVWLGLDPSGVPGMVEPDNRTVGYRRRSIHRLALATNRGLEPLLRRRPALKRAARRVYGRLNARAVEGGTDLDPVLADRLCELYGRSNERLRADLDVAPDRLPGWLR